MKINKQMISFFLFPVIYVLLCGFSLNKKSVDIDTEKNKVYQYTTVDKIEGAFKEDKKAAAIRFEDSYLLLLGTVDGVYDNGKRISITGSSKKYTIDCPCAKEIRDQVSRLSVGSKMAFYGRFSVDPIDKEHHFTVEKYIDIPKNAVPEDTFFLSDGTAYNYTDSVKKELGGGRVSFRIPEGLKDVEVDIKESGLGSIEGYEYILNETGNTKKGDPEYLFVCYFDKKLLKESSDIKRAADVEKAIVENIEGEAGRFPTLKKKTYYGAQYTYYRGVYKESILDPGKGYHTEYIFQEDGDNGIAVLIYVYTTPNHLSDVIFTARFLETAAK